MDSRRPTPLKGAALDRLSRPMVRVAVDPAATARSASPQISAFTVLLADLKRQRDGAGVAALPPHLRLASEPIGALRPSAAALASGPSFTPRVDANSARLDPRGNAGGVARVEQLLADGARRDAELAFARARREADEEAAAASQRATSVGARIRSASPADVAAFARRQEAWDARREQKRAVLRRWQDEREVVGCSFVPTTSTAPTGRSVSRTTSATPLD
jgi:hypothetical protein